MALLNYTTKVDAHKTIADVQRLLAKAGAKAILLDYDDSGNIVALSFKMKLNDQEIGFRLPCDPNPVLLILERDPNVKHRLKNKDQARRVAWRIIKDWVEAQLAIIETKMVKADQVFLPYAITKDGSTIYDQVKRGNLLGDGK